MVRDQRNHWRRTIAGQVLASSVTLSGELLAIMPFDRAVDAAEQLMLELEKREILEPVGDPDRFNSKY